MALTRPENDFNSTEAMQSDLPPFNDIAGANQDAPITSAIGVTPVTQTQEVSTRPVAAGGISLKEVEQDGFEGVVIDWTTFPSISLQTDGLFEDTNGQNYGKEFYGRMMGSKSRFLYKAVGTNLNNKVHLYWSTTPLEKAGQDELIQAKIREWANEGRDWEFKHYVDVYVVLDAPGTDDDGDYRILSVSPCSRGRYTNAVLKARAIGRGDISAVRIKFSVGDKIKEVQNPYYPWNFSIAQ